mgnify:CR=1 FL=1
MDTDEDPTPPEDDDVLVLNAEEDRTEEVPTFITEEEPPVLEGGLLEPIDPAKIAQFGDLVPQFNAQQAIRYQDQLYGVPWNWGSLPLMYDPAAVAAPPESWLDIKKPEFKGKVAMVDDPLGNLLIWGTVVTGKPMGTLLTREELAKVIDELIDIKKNHARAFFATYGDMSDAFARNEVTVSAIGWEAVAVWTKAKGKEIKYTIPKEGTGMFMDCLCIPKDAPNAELSYKMINHVISPEPQKIFATEQSAGITNLKAVPLLSAELTQSYNYADLDNFMQKARLQPVPPSEYDGTTASYDDFLTEYARLQKA